MFLKPIVHPLIEVMFLSDTIVIRSLIETSKPAAITLGGPFPHTPVAKAVVAGIGCFPLVRC